MGETRENIEKEVRESFEAAYKERLLTMKNFYEMRFQTLQETMSGSYKRVLQDEILTTMVRDSTTVSYLEDRVKELFKEIIENEREVLIEKLGLQYSELKFHYQELEKKYATLKRDSETSQQRSFKDRLSSETERSEVSEHIRKKEQEVFELKLELKEKTVLVREKERSEEDLKAKLNELKEDNLFLKHKLEKFEEEVSEAIGVHRTKFELKEVDLQESKKKLSVLQDKLREIEKENEDRLALVEKKYRKKVAEYKAKIEEYKAKILELINQRQPEEAAHNEVKVQELEKRLATVSREVEKKMSQLKSQKEREKADMERKYENKNKQLQNFYEKLMEEKIEECQRVAMETVTGIKAEEDQIRKYIAFLEENSAPLQDYQQLSRLCESLKEHLENKIAQNQKMASMFTAENKELRMEFQETEKSKQEMGGQIETLQSALNEANSKIKYLDQQSNAFKAGEKKSKAIIGQLEADLMAKTDENMALRNELQKLRAENTEQLGTISERQNLYLQKCHEAEQLEKRVERQLKEIQLLQETLHNSQLACNNLKKTVAEKENKLETMAQDFKFGQESLSSQLAKSALVIEACQERVKELTEKCASMETVLNQSNRQRVETQTNLRKAQLENKFISESEEAFRKQHEAYVTDFRKKLEERDHAIQELQEAMAQNKKLSSQVIESKQAKVRKLSAIINRILRTYSGQVDQVNRTIKDLRVYVSSAEKFFKTEIKMMENNALIRVREEVLTMASIKNDEIRKIKDALQYEKSQQVDSSKLKTQEIEAGYKEKLEVQVRGYQTVLASKEKDLDKLEKQKRKMALELQQFREANHGLQKKIKDLEIVYENEKIQAKSKITQALRSFDTQRAKLIQEHSSKREKQEEELEELAKTMRDLRKELHQLKLQKEEQKNRLMAEESSFGKRERELERELEKKRLEAQNLSEQLKEAKANYARLESESRALAERSNSMVHSLAEAQMKNQQLIGELSINKARADRLAEENQDIRRELSEKQSDKAALEQSKMKMEAELREIRSTISKSSKSSQLRALQQLDLETKELSSKVNQLRKVNVLMSHDRTPLRS